MKNILLLLSLLPSFAFADVSSDYSKADKDLNATYQNIIKKLTAQQKQKLSDNQKAWHEYSRGFCSLAEGHPIIEQSQDCLIPFINARNKELKSTICNADYSEHLYCLIIKD